MASKKKTSKKTTKNTKQSVKQSSKKVSAQSNCPDGVCPIKKKSKKTIQTLSVPTVSLWTRIKSLLWFLNK